MLLGRGVTTSVVVAFAGTGWRVLLTLLLLGGTTVALTMMERVQSLRDKPIQLTVE